MSTTIYLDVDGVLNAITSRPPSEKLTGWTQWDARRVNSWPIMFSTELIAALNELAARPDVSFKWLTTWQAAAATQLSPALELEGQEWEALEGDLHRWGGRDWWKLRAIRDDATPKEGERFVWIDDDISGERPAIEWAQSRPDVLAISPSQALGLTRDDLDSLTAFIDQAAG